MNENVNLILEMDEQSPLRDIVFKTLRKAILHGELRPKERLLELQLANKLGVSRTPVREAIRKLELEGLVVMQPRKGARVAQITLKGLQDVLEIRRVLEVLAIQKACKNIKEEQIEQLREALNKFKDAKKRKDTAEIAETDVLFHDIIYKATNNEKLIGILNNLREQLYRYRVEYIKDARYHDVLLDEHSEMIAAIASRNDLLASDIAIKHIDNQERVISKSLME